MKKIAVLYLGRKGGGAKYSLEMTKALLEKNVNIFAIIAENIENRWRWENLKEKQNYKLYLLPTYSNKINFFKSFFPNTKYRDCINELMVYNPDAIYIPMITLNAWKIISHFDRKLIVTTIHDVVPHPGERNPLQYFIFENIKKRSSKFIVLTNSFRNIVSRKYNIAIENIGYIPHAGFCFNPAGAEPKCDEINYSILFFGRITPYKGLLVLLKAMEIIKSKIPMLKLVIAGDGDITEAENKIIKRNRDCINLITGWIPDDKIYGLFEKSDLVVLPYIEASQSGVAAASFGAGRTIIASNIGGLKEQVEPGGGVIFEAGNAEALADALVRFYSNTTIIKQKNEQALAYFKQALTWGASAQKLIDFL